MLTEKDLKQIEAKGLTLREVMQQLETFARGIPYVEIVTYATIGNGVEKFTKEQEEQTIAIYEKNKDQKEIVKFVPASGAATRMFKFLYQFLEQYHPEKQTFRKYLKKSENHQVATFFKEFNHFAFAKQTRKKIRKLYPEYKNSLKGERNIFIVKAMLEENGLNFANMPKGLIPFHQYNKYFSTAFEEQLLETAHYAAVENNVYTHFTFSEKHLDLFKQAFNDFKGRITRKTKKKFHITYSFQKETTDTIALTPENKPFRDEKGQLVFRPSGHGALLENLNEINADLIFIKNIDNVAAAEFIETTAYYKKMLAGRLLQLQEKIHYFLKALEKEVTLDFMKEAHAFIWNELHIKDIPSGRGDLIELLNRPLRVCGVVENNGAPGGGPFWVKDEEGNTSLQIVEASQIDLEDNFQKSMLQKATHFNPVDIVCAVKDYKGNKFNLSHFSNPNTGFIAKKFENGKPLKALELPGLWNGGMAYWITVFVEIPISTFNPVKTVNDLLQKPHRPGL